MADQTEAAMREHLSNIDSVSLLQLFETHAKKPLEVTLQAVAMQSPTLALMAACSLAREIQRRIEDDAADESAA